MSMSLRLNKIVFLFGFSVFLSGCTLPFGQKSGIQITSNPQADILINGENKTKTPLVQEGLNPGSYTVRLTPEDTSLSPFEIKVNLNPGTFTVIDHQFGKTQDLDSGFVLTFEKLGGNIKTNEVSIVTTPPHVAVLVDGSPSNFSGQPIQNISSGDRVFTLQAPGYQDKIVRANVKDGYRLVVNAQLASQPIQVTPTPTPIPTTTLVPDRTITPSSSAGNVTPLPKQGSSTSDITPPYVEILDTPTGWLKVRQSPSTSSPEVAKVNPGDKFAYKESSTSGWFQIEYVSAKWGYVSNQYSRLVK